MASLASPRTSGGGVEGVVHKAGGITGVGDDDGDHAVAEGSCGVERRDRSVSNSADALKRDRVECP